MSKKDAKVEQWMEYKKLNRFEKSLIDNPMPKNDWEQYVKWVGKPWHENSPEEIVEYKRGRVQSKIFRWLRDGRARFQTIIEEKTKSIESYEKRCQFWSTPDNMMKKLKTKKQRLKYYQDKVDHINYVIDNYTEYTYEELERVPDRVFE